MAEKDPVALGLRPRFAPPVFPPGVELRGWDAAPGFVCMKGLSGAEKEENGEVMFSSSCRQSVLVIVWLEVGEAHERAPVIRLPPVAAIADEAKPKSGKV